jgi:histone-lysine N-methyltransferase EZH2
VFRLLLALEDTRSAEEDEEDAQELISPVNLALASRVSNVPAAIIKHYFSTHTGLLTWKTQRARDLTSVMNGEEFYERFCRQCKLFECPLHIENNKWTPVHIARRTADLRDVPRNLTPCSDTCHLKVPLKEFSAHMPPEKVTLLKRGVIVLAKHYCRIRKCIAPSFTCAEIRDYAVAHLSTVHSLPKMAAPEPKEFNVQRKKKMSDKELAAYQPCSHEGPCSAKLCYCYAHNLHCEKYCACSADCSNRFKGCKCLGSCAGNCACARNRRECDLDVCKCDARTCAQRDLQTKKPKHLWIGASAVAGFGVFAVDRIKSGEFIGEYVGEVIPNNEAERRGLIADKIKRSYLFDTGSELCVDSTKFGNRLKFANHSATPNCAPKQLRVNGALRLAFYAVEDIEPNEELFINYDYADPSSKGITNERPVDVRANKGQLSLSTVLQSSSQATGQISAVHETDDSDSSSETSDEVLSVQAM